MWPMSDDFNVVKVHLMMAFVDMARILRIVIAHQDSLFVLILVLLRIGAFSFHSFYIVIPFRATFVADFNQECVFLSREIS